MFRSKNPTAKIVIFSIMVVLLSASCAFFHSTLGLTTPTLQKTPSSTRKRPITHTPSLAIPSSTIPSTMSSCPGPRSNLIPEFKSLTEACAPKNNPTDPDCDKLLRDEISDYLSKGGDIESVYETLSDYRFWATGEPLFTEDILAFKDVTGDSVPELIIAAPLSLTTMLEIFACHNGKYKLLENANIEDVFKKIKIITIEDMDGDGINDVVTYTLFYDDEFGATIYSWHDDIFQYQSFWGTNVIDYHLEDINSDNLKEITLISSDNNLGRCYDFLIPLREEKTSWYWDGNEYKSISEYSVPIYRFQAIQDGDRETILGEYTQALEHYHIAISDKKLEWFSPERKQYLVDTCFQQHVLTPTPYPTPIPDQDEYPKLAAYSYYRILLINLILEDLDSAQQNYKLLNETFSKESPGYPYVELATAFWDEYQSSADIAAACNQAVQYATSHPEILTVLGDGYHGWVQNRIYTPEDVCPFR